MAYQDSVKGFLQARILEYIGQHRFGQYTFLEHYSSCALAISSPEYLVLPKTLQPKQLHHLHTWPSLGQVQVLQGSLRRKCQWITHMQKWK